MDVLPDDAFWDCLSFLANDGVAIGRLSICSSGLYEKIKNNSSLWKSLCQSRWTSTSGLSTEFDDSYRIVYRRRYILDQHATKLLTDMTEDVCRSLELKDCAENVISLDDLAEHVWEHPSRDTLFNYRYDIADVLRMIAQKNKRSTSSVHQKLLGFLACRFLRNIEFADCLLDLEELSSDNSVETDEHNSIMMERYNILMCQIQQTPEEQLDVSKHKLARNITDQLDEIANECILRMKEQPSDRNSVSDKLHIVKDVLLNEYQFSGNIENYYDYRNSLLSHVLVTKKGIPITLCTLFTCVCRRLNIQTFLVGLPGHVVLGFQEDNSAEIVYLDVFRTGQILSVEDCQRICNSYDVPWNNRFLEPLTASKVFDRTFNNLENCHVQAALIHSRVLSSFTSELYVQKNIFEFIHRKARSISSLLVEQITKDLLCNSQELLRYYGL